jgi:pyrroline-5-carboxylate reductase
MPLGQTIAFLGAGNMAEALVKGLLGAGVAAPQEILCTDRRPERGPELTRKYGVRFTQSNTEAVKAAGIVVLSVKPQVMDKVLDEIGALLDQTKLVISIAAGVPLAAIERKVGHGVRIVRTMPNTPALVGAGATALSPGEHATEADLAQAKALFDAIGKSVIVDEPLLDAVTGLSGSGPAYIFLIIEALADGGVKAGLARQQAMDLAAQTVFGSAKLLIETGEHPGRLKDQVTSPGGTAIAGLHTLEAGGLRTTLMNAVESATNRSRELGRKFLAPDDG